MLFPRNGGFLRRANLSAGLPVMPFKSHAGHRLNIRREPCVAKVLVHFPEPIQCRHREIFEALSAFQQLAFHLVMLKFGARSECYDLQTSLNQSRIGNRGRVHNRD